VAGDDVQTDDITLLDRTTDAHRAYLEALLAWEQAVHRQTCDRCGQADAAELATNSVLAELEKERRSMIFSGLCDPLGHVPDMPASTFPRKNVSARVTVQFIETSGSLQQQAVLSEQRGNCRRSGRKFTAWPRKSAGLNESCRQ